MTREEFNRLVEKMVEEERQTAQTKGEEYAGSDDVLSNFKHTAQRTGTTVFQAIGTMLLKQVDAVMYFVRTGRTLSEDIRERLKDIRNYAALFRAAVEEQEKSRDRLEELRERIWERRGT